VISRALNVHARVQGDTGGRPASFAATRVGPALTEQRVVVRPREPARCGPASASWFKPWCRSLWRPMIDPLASHLSQRFILQVDSRHVSAPTNQTLTRRACSRARSPLQFLRLNRTYRERVGPMSLNGWATRGRALFRAVLSVDRFSRAKQPACRRLGQGPSTRSCSSSHEDMTEQLTLRVSECPPRIS
jgi:hypothetical protein